MFAKKRVFAALTTLIILSLSASLKSQPVFIGVNCGSDNEFISPLGDVYAADQPFSDSTGYGFVGGLIPSWIGNNYLIGGTENLEPIYPNRRKGNFWYRFNVEPGYYAVTLHFCELNYHYSNFRGFSVEIEDETVIEDLDIFELVGREYALSYRFLTFCIDGSLEIAVNPGVSVGILNGVSVRAIFEDIDPPVSPAGLNAIGGYEMNILYWDENCEPDFAGYRVYRRSNQADWELITPGICPLYRYLDYDVEPGFIYDYKVEAVDLWGNCSNGSVIEDVVSISGESSTLPIYSMEITEENMQLLCANPMSEEYIDCNVSLDGAYFADSGVRFRGNTTRNRNKKSYKINLPSGVTYQDRDKINAISEVFDFSMMKDRFCYETYEMLDCINPTFRNVHVKLNDDFIGLYLEVEQIDGWFIEKRNFPEEGNLYKCESNLSVLPSLQNYQEKYEKENNPESGWDDLIDFIEWINYSSDAEFNDGIANRLDLDEFIDVYVGYIATAERDFVAHNFYLYFNPEDELWHYIPWDHNCSMYNAYSSLDLGTSASPVYPSGQTVWNILIDRVLSDSDFRYSFLQKLKLFLQGDYSLAANTARIEATYSQIEFDAVRDVFKYGWEKPDLFQQGPDSLIEVLQLRIPFLLNEIESELAALPVTEYFRLNEIQPQNSTTIPDNFGQFDPWLEIYNDTPIALNLGGYTLHHYSTYWTIPSSTIIEGHGHHLIWLDGQTGQGAAHSNITLSPFGGTVRLKTPSGETADVINFNPLCPDLVWARETDGTGGWTDIFKPTPARTNAGGGVFINELLPLNQFTNCDEYGDYDDWLELYNCSDETVDLNGFYLTDDPDFPCKWQFPDTSITPNTYLLIWCDDEPEQGSMHASFRLSAEGETILMFTSEGETILDSLTFPTLEPDISYGYLPDNGYQYYILQPTPGMENISFSDSGNTEPAESPHVFRLEAIYPNPFNHSVTIKFEVAEISHVQLIIYNVLGKEVLILHDGELPPGEYTQKPDMSHLPSGVYFCGLKSDRLRSMQKIILLK